MAFNIQAARADGISDSDIADHLADVHGFNISAARADGISDRDIANHLAEKSTTLAKAKGVVAPKSIMGDAQPSSDRLAAIRAGVTTDENGRVSTVEDRAMAINVDRAIAQPGGPERDTMAETSRFLQGNTSPRIADQEAVTRKPEQMLADSTEGATRFVENERNRVAQEAAAKKQARIDSLHILARTDTPEGMNARRILESEGAAVSQATDQRNFASQNPTINDVGIDFRSGVAKVPGAFTGLIDIAPALIIGGRPADVLFNEIGKITGFQPADYANKMEQNYSLIRKQGMKDITAAWDDETKTWWDVTKAYANNPGVTAGNVIQSIPSMVAGGIVGRATVLGRAGLAPAAMQEAAVMAGAVGEGAMMAGQQMDTMNRSVDPRMAALASLATGVMGAAVGKYSGAMASKLGIRDVDTLLASGATNAMAMPFYKRIPAAMVQEGIIEEGMQSSMEQMLKNIAEDKPVTQGVARATVEGALAGSAMGGAVALPPGTGIAPTVPHPNAQPGSLSSAANIAAQQGIIPPDAISAEDILGAPEAQPSAETVSARTPASMSILEGVSSGSATQPATPAVDHGRAESAGNNAAGSAANGVLQHDAATGTGGLGMPGTAVENDGADRASPNGSDQPRHVGNPSEVILPDNTALPAQWEVVDADQVTATLKEGKNQPRDRSRAAANAQVQGIANMPDYRRLADAPVMDVGAPTLSQDGAIVGGNGRFEGVSRAYDQGTAAEYRMRLEADAITKGIDPATFAGMKKPVLVRRITQPFNVRALAVASNSGGSLQYSALEQAKIDGDRMTALGDVEVSDTGDIVMTAGNMANVRRALTGYNAAELGALTDKDGLLSQEGIRRIKNALLYKAYGNSSVLSRLVESADSDLRAVSGALVRAAGSVASVRADMAAGNKHADADIAIDLISAVELLSKIKSSGSGVDEYMAQHALFGKEYTPEAATILRFMSENIRSQKRMAEFIKSYYDVLASEDHLTGGMFNAAPVSNKERLDHAAKQTNEGADEARGAATPEIVHAQNQQQPEGAQGAAERGREGQQDTGIADTKTDIPQRNQPFSISAQTQERSEVNPQEEYQSVIGDLDDAEIEHLFKKAGLHTKKSASTTDKRAILYNESEAKIFPLYEEMLDNNEVESASVADRFNAEDDFDYSVENFPKPKDTVNAVKAAKEFIAPDMAARKLAEWKAEAVRIGKDEDHSNEVVISLFDESGAISEPWREAGYDVRQYDIKLGDDLLEYFPSGDIIEIKESGKKVIGIIAQPPCTCFSSSGARWWSERHDVHDRNMVNKMFGHGATRYFSKPKEYTKALVALTDTLIGEFRDELDFWVVENPVGRIATEMGLPKPTLIYDPNVYGDAYTKRTQLWGKFNTDLPTANVEPTQGSLMHKLWSSSEKDGGLRSRTPEGFSYSFFIANHQSQAGTKADQGRAKAQADMDAAMAEMGALLRSTNVLNIIPEDHQKLLPVLVKMFDAAFRLGYYEMKDATRYVRALLKKLDARAVFLPKSLLDQAAREAVSKMPAGFFDNQGVFAQQSTEFALAGQTNADINKQIAAKDAQAAADKAASDKAEADKEARAKEAQKAAAVTRAENPDNFVFGESKKDAVKPMGSLFDQQPSTESSQAITPVTQDMRFTDGIIQLKAIPKNLEIENPSTGKGAYNARKVLAAANQRVEKLEALRRCLG